MTVTKSMKTRALSVRSISTIPWQGIADAYNQGLSETDISKKFGLYRSKQKNGKKNPYPNYLVVGYLQKLAHGVTIRITRGAKNKARTRARGK